MDFQKLQNFIETWQEPPFRLRQIAGAMLRQGKSSFLDITVIPLELRRALTKEINILSFSMEQVVGAKDERTFKAVLKLGDGNIVESVFMAPKLGEWSACLSCQAGCAMGCAFCATGALGLKRNLTAEEITDQVLFWQQYFKNMKKSPLHPPLEKGERGGFNSFTHLVFLFMFEPGANWPAVSQALRDLLNPELFGFGSRGIAVSTCGLPLVVANMAKEFPQVNLALSLHFANDEKRSQYMPINRVFNLAALRGALQNYFKTSRRKVFIEYVMLDKINDSKTDAEELARYLKSVGPAHLLHINLIPYNTASGESLPLTLTLSPKGRGDKGDFNKYNTCQTFIPSSSIVIKAFGDCLRHHGFRVTVRRSLGLDIRGACAQLGGGI